MTVQTLDVGRIRAITLDLDDTLWPLRPTIERAEAALRAWLDAHAPRAGALARDAAAQKAARRAVLAAQPDITHDLAAFRRETIRHLLRAADADTALAEPAFAAFNAERQRVTLFADALPALAWLSQRFAVIALSNGSADIGHIGIGQYFQGAVNAAQAGAAKPDARLFHAGARAAGAAPHEVLHVGDDPHLDGIGALRAGMQLAWVNRTQAAWPLDIAEQPHITISTLAELCERLR